MERQSYEYELFDSTCKFTCRRCDGHFVLGMSGTGKTSPAYAMGRFLDNEAVVVPIQPMWKECSDMVGYFNEFTKKFNEAT